MTEEQYWRMCIRLDIIMSGISHAIEDLKYAPDLVRHLCPKCKEHWTRLSCCAYCATKKMQEEIGVNT